MQFLLEVCDLEYADFVQYKPEDVFGQEKARFLITRVQRDRKWYTTYFPRLEFFVSTLRIFAREKEGLDMMKEDKDPSRIIMRALGMEVTVYDPPVEIDLPQIRLLIER